MLVRILSAVIALPLFFVVVLCLPPVWLVVAVSALSAVATYELLWRTHAVDEGKYVVSACVLSAFVPFWAAYLKETWMLLLAVFALFVLLAAFWLSNEPKGKFSKLAITLFGATLIPLLFSTLVLLRQMEQGIILIFLPFISAWMTDTGAYFTGFFFGKHKLAPRISPKKTIEGAVGGVLICALSMALYAWICNTYFDGTFQIAVLGLTGLVLSVLSQIGDLSLSIIKREYNIKDYGVIFPGHGGILDRFDSVLFTAPATYFALQLLQLIA